ncbi:MAG: nucleotidyltransferase domain-containing protein [Bacteroidia bacterium]|nr:nucleotidyltransferase domain-containing protein [Bacteroidia bacterium]
MAINQKTVLEEISRLLKSRKPDSFVKAVLFGSRLTSQGKPDSDYDILIIVREKADWKTEREISDICYEVELNFNVVIDIHILSEPEVNSRRGQQPIFVNALLHGLSL